MEIFYQNKTEDKLKLEDKKYAFFEIITQEDENTVYLYCSDIESSKYKDGIFEGKNYENISVIACDIPKVTDMACMFAECSRLKDLGIGNDFDTTRVTDMEGMFFDCNSFLRMDLWNKG